MAAMTITIEPDELLGVSALVELEAARGGSADVTSTARKLMRSALAARLADSGLPWAPSPEAVQERAEEATRPGGALLALTRSRRFRKTAGSAVAVILLILLWGGFIRGWTWTGFQSNDQLWNWLHLLLLPVVVGTIPLWIEHGEYISRARSTSYLLIAGGFAVFTAAGYLVPLRWTGFPGNTLWNWFQLILLPVAVAALGVWPSARRALRPHHKVIVSVVLAGWLITIVGGYGLGWAWTGYAGNTLWDWVQLLLLPVILPTVLQPAALKWVSGNAAQRAQDAHQAPELRPEPQPEAGDGGEAAVARQ